LYARIFSQTSNLIPENQYGFCPGRSTIQAINSLIEKIEQAQQNEKPLYVLFIDIRKAFDTCSREKVLETLASKSNLSKTELLFISELLKENFYIIDDKVNISEKITQTQGLKQGSVLSPLFFNLANHDINEAVKHLQNLSLLSYADDTALASTDLNVIKNAILALIKYFEERNLALNLDKCKIMKFRKNGQGRYKKTDKLEINGTNIEFVKSFNYLGVTFQSSGMSFNDHIHRRRKFAMFATFDLPKLCSLSIDTGLKLFNLKIAPILSYGIEAIWKYLTLSDFRIIEKVKGCFIRKLLSVDKSSRSKFTYSLVNSKLFVEELKQKFNLPETPAFLKFYDQRLNELNTLPDNFFAIDAFTNEDWKGPQYKLRHVFTRFACHGFHHLICKNKTFHASENDKCICELCEKPCDRYHLKDCTHRVKSIIEYATMKPK